MALRPAEATAASSSEASRLGAHRSRVTTGCGFGFGCACTCARGCADGSGGGNGADKDDCGGGMSNVYERPFTSTLRTPPTQPKAVGGSR